MATLNKNFRAKNGAVIEGTIQSILAGTQDSLIISGGSSGSSSRTLTLQPASLATGNQVITFPDATGTVALTANNLSVFASTTSSQLAGVISDETGSGALVFATSPSLITPSLGVATATSINKLTITAPAASAVLTIADGKTFTVNNTLTFTGTDASSVAFGTGGTVAYTSNNLGVFAATTSAQLAGIISDETGSGALVFATSPTLTTPNIGVATGTSFNSITGLSATTPNMDGVAAVGTGTTAARGDHTHPTDTSRAPINNPIFTGTVTLPGDPTQALHAATKQYVDTAAAGLNAHAAVVAATTANLTATYNNGSSGVGATLTNSGALAAFTIDGQTPLLNDRVLVKNQTTAAQNGIYTITTLGTGAIAWVLTRAVDQDTTPEMGAGDLVYITAGTANGTTLWVQTAKITTIGTDAVNWTQFSGASTATAGAGLVQNGNAYDVVGTANRITVNTDNIDIASTYVGQTSITTLGTIGTGTWQGSLIGATYGGTGVNNGSNTITLGGNISTAAAFTTSGANALTLTTTGVTNATLPSGTKTLLATDGSGSSLTFGTGTLSLAGNVTHSGAFTQTFVATGNTNVTLPTTGTLATLAGNETLSNKASVGLRDTSAAFDVQLGATSSVALTANRTLTLDVVNAARTIKLAGNLDLGANLTTATGAITLTGQAGGSSVTLPSSGTLLTTTGSGSSLTFGTGSLSLAGNLTTSGAFGVTLTATATTNVTLPTTGTLATLAGTETLTNKVSVGFANGQISSSTVTCPTAGTGYTLDTFAVASFTSAKYMVQGTSGTERELTELLVTVNANDVHIAEYGNVLTSGDLFNITATLAAGTVTITITPTTGNGGLVAKAMRTVIAL